MKLSELKNILKNSKEISFRLPNGDLVPTHFHVTEVGKISRQFIDCGGTIRNTDIINLQLWSADDYNHRLHPEKLENIINLSIEKLALQDLDVEVEYQGKTIEKYRLEHDGEQFLLTTTETDCLAPDKCEIPTISEESVVKIPTVEQCCSTSGNCC